MMSGMMAQSYLDLTCTKPNFMLLVDSEIKKIRQQDNNNTQFGTENCCNLVVVQLVKVKGLMCQWDPSKSLVGQETPATNFLLYWSAKILQGVFRRIA
jgi:hypothetical protein